MEALMRRQVVRLSVHQTSKVLAVLYFVMGLVLMPFFVLASRASPEGRGFGLGFALLLPVVYGAIGYVFVAIGCAAYNFVVRFTGGIEVDVAPVADDLTPVAAGPDPTLGSPSR
jgi:hypothetical protein